MNFHHLGVQLIWIIGQVTLLLSLGLVLYLVAKPRGPAMRSLFAAGTLATALLMTALALSPWPRWCNVSLASLSATQAIDQSPIDGADASRDDATTSPDQQRSNQDDSAGSGGAVAPARGFARFDDPARAAISAFWQALHDNLATPSVAQPPARNWQWPSVLAAVFLIGFGIALARLLVGLFAVARYRQTARPIDDASLLSEISELRTTLACTRRVTLCESETIGTPATIGWRRPLILLPVDWRDWNAADRRAVLAHELAHIARGDYLSGLIARMTTALHFYHPLAHWLARRMRFEQELAADACGVACSGGKESYVVALARMALAQDNRALAWAARPFLPNRSTFLRRIEMLRNTVRVKHAPYRPATRRFVLAALAALALVIVGLRGPIAPSNNGAVAQQPGATGAAVGAMDLKGVPEETVVYAAIRPAAILARDAKLNEMLGVMETQFNLRQNAGISPSEVEEFRLMAVDLTVPGEEVRIEPLLFIRTTKPDAWKPLIADLKHHVEDEHRGQKFFRRDQLEGGPRFGWAYFAIDDRTLVLAPTNELALKKHIDAVKGGGDAPRWAGELRRVSGADAALAVDAKYFAKLIDKEMERNPGKEASMALALAPLWRQTNTVVAAAKIDGILKAEVHAICKSEQAADEVAMTLNAGKVLLQNMLPLIRRQMNGEPGIAEIAKLKSDVLDQAEKFLAQVKPAREGNVVTVKIEGTEAFGPMVAAILLPAVSKARDAAGRAQSTNNLKQIALALHMYADVHKAFPAAVMLGPDGKTKHSWRVAILPYIEQESLYKQYKLDEPWDSENNKKVLDRMPATFRHPSEKADSRNSSYFALVGDGGIFSEDAAKKGTGFEKIRDGTSNTVLLVEAKRDIPWTKPEDIPFEMGRDVPKLGGFAPEGFSAALADGSVHFILARIDQSVIKAMFSASGNEPVIVHEALHPSPPGAAVPQRGATDRVLPPRATTPRPASTSEAVPPRRQ